MQSACLSIFATQEALAPQVSIDAQSEDSNVGIFKEPLKPFRVLKHIGQVQSMQAGRLGIYAIQEALALEERIDAQTKIET